MQETITTCDFCRQEFTGTGRFVEELSVTLTDRLYNDTDSYVVSYDICTKCAKRIVKQDSNNVVHILVPKLNKKLRDVGEPDGKYTMNGE